MLTHAHSRDHTQKTTAASEDESIAHELDNPVYDQSPDVHSPTNFAPGSSDQQPNSSDDRGYDVINRTGAHGPHPSTTSPGSNDPTSGQAYSTLEGNQYHVLEQSSPIDGEYSVIRKRGFEQRQLELTSVLS